MRTSVRDTWAFWWTSRIILWMLIVVADGALVESSVAQQLPTTSSEAGGQEGVPGESGIGLPTPETGPILLPPTEILVPPPSAVLTPEQRQQCQDYLQATGKVHPACE